MANRIFLVLLGFLLFYAYPALGQDNPAEAEVRAVVNAYDRALENRDIDAVLEQLAPKVVLNEQSCGKPAERSSKKEFEALMRETLPLLDSLQFERSNEQITFLGGGPIAVFRSLAVGKATARGHEMVNRSREVIFLNEIGGVYKIISLESIALCQ